MKPYVSKQFFVKSANEAYLFTACNQSISFIFYE